MEHKLLLLEINITDIDLKKYDDDPFKIIIKILRKTNNQLKNTYDILLHIKTNKKNGTT